jgi:transposase
MKRPRDLRKSRGRPNKNSTVGVPCAVTLTAGQKGDAPQAAALIEGLPAEVVMADTAYDADYLRQAIAAKDAIAVIPNNPSRALKYPLDKHLYAQRHLVFASQNSSSSAGWQRASRKAHATTAPLSLSQQSSYGSGKCPHHLARRVPRAFCSKYTKQCVDGNVWASQSTHQA